MKKMIYNAIYHDSGYPFHNLAEGATRAVTARDLVEKDSYLVLWGGEDIDPELYNHGRSKLTGHHSRRDDIEWPLLKAAIAKGIPIIGVCRGAQMLCAMAGGYLLQDVRNHAGARHWVNTHDGKSFRVNSLHHQMLAGLELTDHELVAWASKAEDGSPNLSSDYTYRDDQKWVPPANWREPEMVYFPKIKGYAIQWHPEMMEEDTDATQYIFDFIRSKENATKPESAITA